MTPDQMERSALYLLHHTKNWNPPVKLDQIPGLIGASVIPRHDMPRTLSALCFRGELRTYIEVNMNDQRTRRRFSFCHEVKHALHDNTKTAFYTSTVGIVAGSVNAQNEREANIYASLLLMPTDWVVRDFFNQMPLKRLAERYEVSRSAMAFRLRDLGLSTR